MFVDNQSFSECDFCGTKKLSEYGAIARGATGRWCVVLSCCEACLPAEGATPIGNARELIELERPDNEWPDF